MTEVEGWGEMTEDERNRWVEQRVTATITALEEGWKPGAEVRANASDNARAAARSMQLSLVLKPNEIRSRAVMTVRCADCDGMPVAYVTYIDGRPAIWTRPHRKERDIWRARFIDEVYYGANMAYCKSSEFAINDEVIAPNLPSQGEARRTEIRVRHDGSHAVR